MSTWKTIAGPVLYLAYVLQERGSLSEVVDPELGSEYSSGEAMVILNVALLCTNASPTLRPTRSQVASMLEGQTSVEDFLSDPGFSAINTKYKAIRNHFWQNPNESYSPSTIKYCGGNGMPTPLTKMIKNQEGLHGR